MTTRCRCAAVGLLVVATCAGGALAAEAAGDRRNRPNEGKTPEQVRFLVYVLDIDEINSQDQNFAANLVLRLRWQDERLAHSGPRPQIMPVDDLWHPNVLLTNRQALVRTPLGKFVSVDPDGNVTFRQQYVGPLSQPLRLRDFPLDVQTFTIQFAAAGFRPEDLQFVPDAIDDRPVGGGMAKVLSLPDWRVLSYKAEPRPYQVTETMLVPGFAFEFVARRHISFFLWQAMMPLALIVMMSWAPFWIDPSRVELQFGIAGSTVLTLIAYRFTLARLLPALPYLTRMDLLTVGGTILVFLSFLEVALTSALAHQQRVRPARRLDKVCRVLFPLAFAGVIAWSMIL